MVGRQIGRYQLVEQIGSGGMSVVWRGHDTKIDRDVAVKLLHPHLNAREDSRRRFNREAQAVGKLRHPNILEIFDVSEDAAPEAFIVTEFIRGTTLRAFAEAHRFHPPELAAMAVHELACALEHAHDAGVIHRDLKPENVMINEAGVLKLMDFGIARVLDGDKMTMTGALVGSPNHMAPEVIEGQEAGREADVFSVGTILYWLCCQKLPFAGNNQSQTFKLILDGQFSDPRLEAPAISDDLASVLRRCLAREPSARYRSAGELKEALASVLSACGIDEPGKEFALFHADPDGCRTHLQSRLVERLLSEAERHVRGPERNFARASDRIDRVLALEPGNAKARALESAMRNQDRRRKALRAASVAAVGVALIGGAAYLGHQVLRIAPPERHAAPAEPVSVREALPEPRVHDPAPQPVPPAAEPAPALPEAQPPPVEAPRPPPPRAAVGRGPTPAQLLSRKPPAPLPIAAVETREVQLNLQPPIYDAIVRIDDGRETHRGSVWEKLTLTVGRHVAHVQCTGCPAEPISFEVKSVRDLPGHKPIELPVRRVLEGGPR